MTPVLRVTELSAKQGVLLLAQLCLGIRAAAHSVYSVSDHEFLHARILLKPRGDSIALRKCFQRMKTLANDSVQSRPLGRAAIKVLPQTRCRIRRCAHVPALTSQTKNI
jgi:hypothetical protein